MTGPYNPQPAGGYGPRPPFGAQPYTPQQYGPQQYAAPYSQPQFPQPPAPWGYGYPPPPARPPVRHNSYARMLVLLVIGLVVVAVAAVIIAKARTHTTSAPPQPRPPVGNPVATGIVYQGDGFSFEYPKPNGMFSAAQNVTGGRIVQLTVGDGGEILLEGASSGGKTAQQFAASYLSSHIPSARRAYVIPNAFVGYAPGYGEIDDVYVQTSSGQSEHGRLIVLAAVKNGVGVLAVGLGSYQEFGDGLTDGHPSGAATLTGLFMAPMVNSFRWKGDPAR